jgi:hypothetical protein
MKVYSVKPKGGGTTVPHRHRSLCSCSPSPTYREASQTTPRGLHGLYRDRAPLYVRNGAFPQQSSTGKHAPSDSKEAYAHLVAAGKPLSAFVLARLVHANRKAAAAFLEACQYQNSDKEVSQRMDRVTNRPETEEQPAP